ncbi:MAG: hypothetical protein EBZ61_02240 [Micrococcales bacterium]|nr:hypothetical protein [Micrococcales bacterium]
MHSSLYASLRSIISKFAIIPLVFSALVFSSAPARADSQAEVGVNPAAIVVDSSGNAYAANFGSGTISKVTPQGSVSTFADLNPQKPRALAISSNGTLFVATRTGSILRISTDGSVSTFATVGRNPVGLAFDSAGNLYSANYTDSSVSKVTPAGTVSLFARVSTWPSALAFDSSGNLYTTGYLDGVISKVSPSGTVTAQFALVGANPTGIAIDKSNDIYVSNSADNTISKVTPTGTVSSFATVGKTPNAITIDSLGNLYTANYTDATITKVSPLGLVSTHAVTGLGPTALSFDANSNLYSANYLSNSITVVTASGSKASAPRNLQTTKLSSTSVDLSWLAPTDNAASTISDYLVEATTNNGNSLVGTYRTGSNSTSFIFPGLCSKQTYQFRTYAINSLGLSRVSNQVAATLPNGPAAAPENLSPGVIKSNSVTLNWDAPGCDGGSPISDYRISYSFDAGASWTTVTKPASTLTSHSVTGLVLGRSYQFRISSVNASGVGEPGPVSLVTTADSLSVYTVGTSPAAMAFDSVGNLYVANTADNTVSRITKAGVVSRFATVGDNPAALAFDAAGNLYTANSDDGTVTKVTPTGVASVFATVGDRPTALAFDSKGNLYTADSISGTISKITSSGVVSVFANLASNPVALVFDAAGNLFSANGKDNTVSKITPAGEISSFANLPIPASRMVSDTNGNLYVFSTVDKTAYKITPTGLVTGFITLADSITDLVIDNKNNFYFANATDGSVAKLTAAGTLSTLATFDDSIVRIITDSNGNLFTSFGEGKVAKSVLGNLASAPKSPAVSQLTATGLTLSWSAPDSDGGSALMDYRVEQSSDGGSSWTPMVRQASTVTSFQVTGLTPAISYQFRIASVNGLGNSPYSTVVSATTNSAPPSAPRSLEISQITSTGMLLNWQTPISTNGQPIKNYLVEISSDAGVNWNSYTKPVSTLTSVTISGLVPAKSYSFRVFAVNQIGTGQASPLISATTLASVPTQPKSLTAGQVSSTTVSLSWLVPDTDSGSAITDYRVEQSSDGGSTWAQVAKSVSTATSFQVSGLAPGTSYQFRVAAVNGVGVSGYSNVVTATTNSAPPSAARNLEISQITATGMLLNWQPPVSTNGKPVSNYLVELSSDAGVTWVSYQKPDSTLTSVTISGLVPAKSYSFRVFAVNQIGVSQASPLISATTLATVPTSPRLLTASAITKTSFTLNWQAPLTDNGSTVSDYQVEMSTNAGASWIKIDKPVSNSTSQNIPNLPAGSSNLFRVIAVNALGLGQPSEVLSVTTKPLVIPAAPASISFTNLKINAASITWSPVTSDLKISNYIIEISADGANWSVVPKKVSTSTSMTITSLSPATNYSIRVAAVNADGQSGYVQGSLTTLGTISSAPSKPNLVSVTMNSATISWDAPAIDGGSPITNYIVEMSGGGSSWTLIQKETSPARSISVADLKPATKYSFRVRAVNSKGMSKVSPILSIATSPNVPGIPTGLAVKSQTASATVLSWTAPNNGGSRLTDYRIEFSLDEGQTWQVLTKGLWTIPIYKLVNLKPKTSYLFRVTAKNSVGFGDTSNSSSVTTP